MAQQNNNNRRSMLIQMVLIWLISFFLLNQFLGPRNAPEPAQAQSLLQQAQALEAEGRQNESRLSKAERIKKLEQASKKYEEYYKANRSSDEGVQARFQQINTFDYLTQLEGESSSTHWFDQAEIHLKDMEKALLGRQGEVKLEVNGEAVTRTGDLGKVASWRLNSIRAARDDRNRSKITWKLLDATVALTGRAPAYSYFLALTLIVVFLKVITFPFLKKQYQYQRDMLRIQPLVKEMQEKMKGRPANEVQQRMMAIYKENNVNLAGGCLPMLVLMVVLFPVFWMVRDYEFQFTKGHFLWIGSEYSKSVWWLADNLAQFDVPLFLIYLVSMVAYSLMQPKPADPQQAQQQKMMMVMMPLMFSVFMWMGQWSSAFMLYWLVLNVVSMYQSWVLMKQFGLFGSGGSAGKDGGGDAPVPPAPTPLTPMKGVQTVSPNPGRGGRGGRGGPRRGA